MRLPSEPFKEYLRGHMAEQGISIEELAARCERDGRAIRHWLTRPTVQDATVEFAGIVLDGDPRVPARLYPELDW